MNFFRPLAPLLKGWLLSFAIAGIIALAVSTQFLALTHAPLAFALRSSARDQLPWAILAPLLFRFTNRWPIHRRKWASRLLIHVIVCCAVFAIYQWWERVVDPGFRSGTGLPEMRPAPSMTQEFEWPPTPPPPSDGGKPPTEPREFGDRPPPEYAKPATHHRFSIDLVHLFTYELPVYLMIICAAHAAVFYRRDQERAANLAHARLDNLRAQLQPHFLFNTLNTIAGLVHTNPDKADTLITHLSELLRLTLRASSETFVPLAEEAEFLTRYFSILQVRFDGRIAYDFDLTPTAGISLVPPLLLQPLVENAVRHGLETEARGGRVTVKAWTSEKNSLHLVVSDNGKGVAAGRAFEEGTGLSNVRSRLTELYGGDATMAIHPQGGFTVEITIPFRAT
jgi:Histidine kinase/Histidine kinase-, DNA gyrase B-, and HSP90-like ATPase